MGGVTGGVRFPLPWRGGVETLLRHRLPVRLSDSLGCTFFFTASCSRRAASVMNLGRRKRVGSAEDGRRGRPPTQRTSQEVLLVGVGGGGLGVDAGL